MTCIIAGIVLLTSINARIMVITIVVSIMIISNSIVTNAVVAGVALAALPATSKQHQQDAPVSLRTT